jgi:Family of unknown function (DUF6518)
MTVDTTEPEDPSIPTRRSVLLIAVVVGVALGLFSLLEGGVGGRLFGILGNIASPWGLAAFLVGYRATSRRQGALAGGLGLVVGVATYYLGGAVRGYVPTDLNVLWTVVALVAGPIMGACGAAVSTRPARPPVLAVAAPAAMLVAEALFLMYDRRPWAWNLSAETYRLIDLGVAVAMIVGGLVLPWVFVKEPRQRGIAYLVVAVAGTFGAFAFVLLERIIVAVA